MMSTYQAIYKCRLCGEVLGAEMTGKEIAVRETMMLACGFYDGRKIPIQTVHFCENEDNFGIANFQGFRKVE